jgi:hypothetical protein
VARHLQRDALSPDVYDDAILGFVDRSHILTRRRIFAVLLWMMSEIILHPAGDPPIAHHMDQLLLVYKDGLHSDPIQGLEVRKAVAELIAADVRVDFLPSL